MKKLLLIGATIALLGAGCAGGGAPAKEVAAPAAPPARPGVPQTGLRFESCAGAPPAIKDNATLEGASEWRERMAVADMPSDFPAPPVAFELCGSKGTTVYYFTRSTVAPLLDYYESALKTAGYTIEKRREAEGLYLPGSVLYRKKIARGSLTGKIVISGAGMATISFDKISY